MGFLTDSTTQGQDNPVVDEAKLATFLAGQADVVLAYLFGSTAKRENDPLSDLDVAVLLSETMEGRQVLERKLRLIQQVGALSPREVDLILLNETSPLLAYEVVRHGRLLHERTRHERNAFEVQTRKVFFDVKPMLHFHSRALLKRIKEDGLGSRQRGRPRALEAARRLHQEIAGAGAEQPRGVRG